ncbi:carboxymuconolactone decarboxylase family protein [Paracoccus seriniphilus]|uniref:Carboxymuconolactone decarboxylase family protein n=1 Tax=Paracoccus seriniphilus TaxID=184748 RepID=A0A239PM94_9RHOB|nr:carboxymuconolactone decarboxylase family protein [Paracoccus seriniphilus]WCR13517.1 carboxymuconolactone decarboxylase family protein [Paracoccus seriniphilus]SNT68901.1 Carboxymuconolactone decarboxylase family protein [Paracoccus seriniphilus]
MSKKIEPLSDSDWPAEIAALNGGFAGKLNVYRTMAHHPGLLAAWAPLRQHVVRDRAMTDQQSEVVILRTGHNLGSAYEWAHHVTRGRAVGMDDARIAALAGPLEGIDEDDRVLAAAVDELFANARLGPDTQEAVTAAIGKAGMFDLMATVGFYSVLGFIVNSFDVPVDDDVATRLQADPAP